MFQLLILIVIIIGIIMKSQSSGDPGISMKLTVPSQDLLKKDMLLKWLLIMISQFLYSLLIVQKGLLLISIREPQRKQILFRVCLILSCICFKKP